MMEMLFQCAVAFVATIAFAALFHAPPRHYIYAGITGAAGWGAYLLCLSVGLSVEVSSFFAAAVLTVLARVFAVTRACPATVFLISGIFPLVPGVGIYYTTYYFISGEMAVSAQYGQETFRIAVAIALGIVMIFSLPSGFFRLPFQRKKR